MTAAFPQEIQTDKTGNKKELMEPLMTVLTGAAIVLIGLGALFVIFRILRAQSGTPARAFIAICMAFAGVGIFCLVSPQPDLFSADYQVNDKIWKPVGAAEIERIEVSQNAISYFDEIQPNDKFMTSLPPEAVLNAGIKAVRNYHMEKLCRIFYLDYHRTIQPEILSFHYEYKSASQTLTVKEPECAALGYKNFWSEALRR